MKRLDGSAIGTNTKLLADDVVATFPKKDSSIVGTIESCILDHDDMPEVPLP